MGRYIDVLLAVSIVVVVVVVIDRQEVCICMYVCMKIRCGQTKPEKDIASLGR